MNMPTQSTMLAPLATTISPGISAEATDLLRSLRANLAGQHLNSLRRLDVSMDGDNVVVCGDVSSFYERQLAITCCRRAAGKVAIVDRISVSH